MDYAARRHKVLLNDSRYRIASQPIGSDRFLFDVYDLVWGNVKGE